MISTVSMRQNLHWMVQSSSSSSSSSGSSNNNNIQQDDEVETPGPLSITVQNVAPVILAAADFEEWMRSYSGACWLDPRVHQSTTLMGGCMRGLAWQNDNDEDSRTVPLPNTLLARIPATMVLSAPQSSRTWDRDLAVQLWQALLRIDTTTAEEKDAPSAKRKDCQGYVRYLVQSTKHHEHAVASTTASSASVTVPASIAPHCVRHWTAEQQRQYLGTSAPGRDLLTALQQQDAIWRQHYNSLDARTQVTMSWEQFAWAMEAVHSRAFCGIQTSTDRNSAAKLLLPSLVAAILGIVYATTTAGQASDTVLAILAVVTALASWTATATWTNSQSAAVLLPWIDSANHHSQADSTILYDPLTQSFELYIGPKCLVTEENQDSVNGQSQRQVYINYGSKTKTDWLLNFGFLPTVPAAALLDGVDDYRRRLALALVDDSLPQSTISNKS
jgi:hypothetical protein